MMVRPFALMLLLSTAPGAAQETPRRVDVSLSSFKFTPKVIELEHGRPYLLHLANTGSGGHDFVAPEFFRAAKVAPADAGAIRKGGVELDGEASADIHLTAPAPGTYKVRCTHFLHATFGMTGTIVVR